MRKAGLPPCLKSLILMVEQRGLEPLASALRTRRSAKLSYCPTNRKNTVSSLRFQEEKQRIRRLRRLHRTEGRQAESEGQRAKGQAQDRTESSHSIADCACRIAN